MMTVLIILIVVASVCNGAMDVIEKHYYRSRLKLWFPVLGDKYFNPSTAWQNKYKNGKVADGERFFGSTTFLAFTTDAWHLLKSLMWTCFGAAICAALWMPEIPSIHPLLVFFILRISGGIAFEITRRSLLV